MKNFINLTCIDDGSEFPIVVNVASIEQMENGVGCALVKVGSEQLEIKQTVEEIIGLIHEPTSEELLASKLIRECMNA